MGNRKKGVNFANKASSGPISSKLEDEEFKKLEEFKIFLNSIKEKHSLTFKDLKKVIFEEEVFFPVEITNKKITFLESIVKYLKEEKNLSLHQISKLINRDERNIWHIYNKANKKHPKKFIIKETNYRIPISILANKKLSALESIVKYLKERLLLPYNEISILLKRDHRTIWTVYQRSRKKYVK